MTTHPHDQATSSTTSVTGPGWVRTFAGVTIAVWCTFASFGVLIAAIPSLVTRRMDASAALVGIAFATTAAVAIVVRPLAGRLAHGRTPRWVAMLGAALATIGAAAHALPFGPTGLLVARIVTGAAEALVMTAGAVWAVSLAPTSRRGQVVGLYGLAMWGGLSAGPAIGDAVLHTGSFHVVIALAIALPTVAIVVLARLPGGSSAEGPAHGRLFPSAALRPGLALAAGAVGYAAVSSFGALSLAERDIAGGSSLLSIFGAAYVTVRLAASRLPDRVGPLPMIVTSVSTEAVGLVIIAIAPNWATAAVGAAVAGGGFTLLYPSLALIAIDRAPEQERGATLGAVSSFLDVAVASAGVIGGAFASVGYAALFVTSALLAISAIIPARAAIATVRRPSRHHSAFGVAP